MTMFDITSNYTGSDAIYSREISRKRSRVTFLYHMSVNQSLIANMVSYLFHSNLSEIWPRIMERKRSNNLLLYGNQVTLGFNINLIIDLSMVQILILTVYNHFGWIHLQHTRMAVAFACRNFLLLYKKVVRNCDALLTL